MKIISFNINGIRAHLHQIDAIITQFQPDIIGLQETKVHDDYFPKEKFSKYGYNTYFYGQKGHYGVAFLTKKKVLNIKKGFHYNENYQKRIIIAEFPTSLGILTIINGYFPQGENIHHPTKFINKKLFYQNFKNYIKNNYHVDSLLLIIGDMNISPTDLDVGFEKKIYNYWIKKGKCSFLPKERSWINQLIHWGLIDVYRYMHPKNNHKCYSWFNYKFNHFNTNKGLRIDLLLATHPIATQCKNIDIIYKIRAMKQPSDHAPILAEFKINY